MTDPVADMLTIIRNGQAVKKDVVNVPFSKFKYEIAKILAKNGFAGKVETEGKKTKKMMKIDLKYSEDGLPAISGLKRISRPGQRIYKGFGEINRVKSGYGMAVISTPRGLMTDKEVRRQKLGGEVICEVW